MMTTEAMDWPYGEVLARYEGRGTLAGAGSQSPCQFELVQLTTGRLLMACRRADESFGRGSLSEIVELQGETEAGQKVTMRKGRMVSARVVLNQKASRVSPHILRHTFATHLIKHGADVRHVQKLLGHEVIDTTAIYTRVAIRDLHGVVARSHPRDRFKRGKTAARSA